MPRTSEPIRRIETPAGVRYVAIADAPHARGEKRRQVRRRFTRRGDAVKWLGQMRAGTAPELQEPEREPEVLTFASIARPWLEVKRRTVRAVTFAGYEKAVKIWTKELGDKPLDQISKADIEALVNRYQDEKRSYSRVSYLIAVCRSILGEGVEEELIGRNVAARVKPRGASAKARQAMTAQEIRLIRIQASKDPWEALWVLSLLGLRRSEVLGLRWSDIDFEAGTLSIRRARVQIGGSRQINVTDPKTANGRRTLPMPEDLVGALKRLRASQMQEFGLATVRDGYLGLDAAGEPIRPEVYSDEWRILLGKAEVRVVTLHEARHSSVTAMREAGVPDMAVAQWHGHDEAVMMRTYSHPSEQSLREAGEAFATAVF